MQLSMKQKGIITLIGGFMVELVAGSVFLWGQMNVYITSYFRQKEDQGLQLSVGGAIFPVMMAAMATGVPLGIKGIKYFGSARTVCILSSIIAAVMVFVSSYTEKFWQFVIIYGVIVGMAQGTIYFVPIYMGYLYFPNNKGMVSGIVTGGFALCSFIFGLIFYAIVNPDGLTQVKDSDGYSYFEGSSLQVAQNVPETLRKMSYMYLGISVFSALFILNHPNQIGEEEKRLKLELKQKQAEKQLVEENIIKAQLREFAEEQKIMNENYSPIPQQRVRKSIQILNHALDIVELQQYVIQKKIKVAQELDENASYNSLFPFSESQNPHSESNLPVQLENNNNRQNSQIRQNSNENQIQQEEKNNFKNETNHKSKFRVYVGNCDIVELNQRILSILQSDNVENKRQHTNSIINENNIIKPTSIENIHEELTKINQDMQSKEKQIKDELESIQVREEEIQRLNKLGAPTSWIALKQPELYMSIFLGILVAGIGMLVNGNYKTIAKDYGFTSDSFQTLVGSLGGIANGVSRPLWSTLLDRFTFKQILTTIICIEIVCSFTMQLTENNQIFFIIWVFIIHMTLGAVLGMWPVLSAQLNGVKVGSSLFGLYWYGFGCATLIQFLLVLGLNPVIGFNNLYYIYAAQAILALLIIQFYKFKVDWSKYYIQEQKKIEIPTQTDTEHQRHTVPTEKMIQ